MKMLGRMLVLGRIAAANLPANHAKPQMHPGVAHLYTLFAHMLGGVLDLDLIQVTAIFSIGFQDFGPLSSAARSHLARLAPAS